ncbi:STAS domain-containing protein [Aestuariibacter sp. AA17]|uniref:STAS domain-containing protein n=1 Tax=Fluctibacter corallii TaxID=2984329 RepID=A0ABT3A7T2_9ALTE|nr:STAS domain-containing protein [Aestuariibacter sp. AA17]MCV2884738.1 STAS domain-containing protein [Aestuariibacter sp. AA17]
MSDPSVILKEHSEQTEIILQGELELESAEQLKSALVHALDLAQPIQINVASVEDCHISSLQLLASLMKHRTSSSPLCQLEGDSEAFLRAVNLSGLGHILYGEQNEASDSVTPIASATNGESDG